MNERFRWLRLLYPTILLLTLLMPFLLQPVYVSADNLPSGRFIVAYGRTGQAANITLNKVTHFIIERVRVASATNMTLTIDTSTFTGINATATTAKAANTKVYIEFYEDWNKDSTYNAIYDNATLRNQLITNLSNLVDGYAFDGVDLDWEADVQSSLNQTNYSTFIMDLKTTMNSTKGITYAAPYNKMPFTVEASNSLELIDVMSYDVSPTPWYGSFDKATTIMNWWASQGVAKSKLTMGISSAGRDGTGGGWYHYHDIMGTYNPATSANSVSNTSIPGGVINYNGQDLAKQKAQWIVANGFGGIMLYDLTADLYGDTRGLLAGIYDVLSATTIAPPDSMSIDNVYIWRNVLQTGDFFTIAVENVSYTSIPTTDISQTFLFRWMNGNLSTDYGDTQGYPYVNNGYGKGVVSWYFGSASNLTWQGSYTAEIQGKIAVFSSPPILNYNIPASAFSSYTDGTSIRNEIATRVISMAKTLETAWGSNYTLTTEAQTGTILSSQGEAYFRMAIPNLQSVCPQLFEVSFGDPNPDSHTWTTTNGSDLWEPKVSNTQLGTGIQNLADLFSVSFLTMAAIPIIIVCVGLVIVGAITGNVLSGFMNAGFVIIPASYYGWFPPVAMFVIAFFAGVYILWHLFGKAFA